MQNPFINTDNNIIDIECYLLNDQSGNNHIVYSDMIGKSEYIIPEYDYIHDYINHNKSLLNQIISSNNPINIIIKDKNEQILDVHHNCKITDIYEAPIVYTDLDDEEIDEELEVALKFTVNFDGNSFNN